MLKTRGIGGRIFIKMGLFYFFTAVLLAVFTFSGLSYADEEIGYVEGEILIKFKKDVNDQKKRNKHSRHHVRRKKKFKHLDIENVELPAGMSVEEAIELYRADPDVEYAEPNYIMHAEQTFPDDPGFGDLWNLYNAGQYGGTPGADIMAPEAWDITTGNGDGSLVVAVIDTGVDYTHEDLAANMWMNPNEAIGDANGDGFPGVQGVDDDGDGLIDEDSQGKQPGEQGYKNDLVNDDDENGYIDDIHGINAITGSGDPMDDAGHGTRVAGIIGAVGNNGIGVTGVAWDIKIIACKFINAHDYGAASDALECLEYVRSMKDKGINIVATNNSWGGKSGSQTLYETIGDQKDILFVTASGNTGLDIDYTPEYPAAYDLPNIITVTGTDRNDEQVYSFGRRSVHVGAPGYDISSTSMGNNYRASYGTSFAAPHVTGLAALLKSFDPSYDASVIRNLILSGGDPVPSLSDRTVTGRRINAYGSVACLDSPVISALWFPSMHEVGIETILSALSINCANPVGPVSVTSSSGEAVELFDDGAAPDMQAGDGVFAAFWTPSNTADSLTFASPAGSETVPALIYITQPWIYDSGGNDTANDMYFDASGTVYVIGSSGIVIYSSDGTLSVTLNISGTDFDVDTEGNIYVSSYIDGLWNVMKYNASGNELWREVIPWSITDIAVEQSGNIYVAGNANNNIMLTKLDNDGTTLWEVSENGNGYSFPHAITVDGEGNVYVTGYTKAAQYDMPTNVMTLKYDSSGGLLWSSLYCKVCSWPNQGLDVAVDGAGNVYVAGFYYTGSYNNNILVMKYDPSGNMTWVRTYDAGGTGDYAVSVDVDSAGNVYVAGRTNSGPTYDCLTLIFDPEGIPVWGRIYDSGADDYPNTIHVNNSGNIYVSGHSTTNANDYFVIRYNIPLQINTEQMPDSMISVFYSKTLSVVGGAGPYEWFVIAGGLPSGLELDSASGVISGVPLLEGSYTFTVRVADNAGSSAIKTFTITINYEEPDIDTLSLYHGTVNNAYSEYLYAHGGHLLYNWQIISGALPGGLSLDPYTGEISGIPSSPGIYYFTVQVTDSDLVTASRDLLLVVDHDVLTEEWSRRFIANGSEWAYGIALDEEGTPYVAGHSNILHYDLSGNLIDTFQRSSFDIALDGAGNVYLAGYTVNGSNRYDFYIAKYDPAWTMLWQGLHGGLNVDRASDIHIDAQGFIYVAGEIHNGSDYDYLSVKYDTEGNKIWEAIFDGGMDDRGHAIVTDSIGNVYVTGYYINDLTFRDECITLKYDPMGNEVARYVYDNGSALSCNDIAVDSENNIYVSGSRTVDGKTVSLIIKYDTAGNEIWVNNFEAGTLCIAGTVVIDYSDDIYVAGNCFNSVTISSNPYFRDGYLVKYDKEGNLKWFRIYDSGNDDVLKDIALDGNGNIYLVSDYYDGNNTDYNTVKFRERLRIISEVLPEGMAGSAYNADLQADGGNAPYVWNVTGGTLPDGLVLDIATGTISGAPLAAGEFNFTVQVSDAASNLDTKDITIVIREQLTVVSYDLSYGVSGSAYFDTVDVRGGYPPYAWSLVSGQLPGGLNLNNTSGEISGLPTVPGTYSFTVEVSDSGLNTVQNALSISVYDPLAIPDTTLPDGVTGNVYSYTLSATGGAQPYSWSITDGALPAGLNLAPSTGEIYGVPSVQGAFAFDVTVTDANAEVASLSSVIVIIDPPVISDPGPLSGVKMIQYSYTLNASGGTPPYSWNITAGSLPDGLGLNGTTGEISGIPAAIGSFSFTLAVTDAAMTVGTLDVEMEIFEKMMIEEWERLYDAGADDRAMAVTVDPDDNVIVTGSSYLNSEYTWLTIKYDRSGNELWTATYDDGLQDLAYAVTSDMSGNIYVVGSTDVGGNNDFLIIKYDTNGNVIWTETYDRGQNDTPRAVAVDSSGNIYVTGMSYIGGNYDYLTIVLDAGGSLIWSDVFDIGTMDIAYGIAVDGSQNIYVTGNPVTLKYSQTGTLLWSVNNNMNLTFDVATDIHGDVYIAGGKTVQSNSDFIVKKFDPSGNELWIRSIDSGSGDYGTDITTDVQGNIYATGHFNRKYMTIKYDSAGNVLLKHTFDSGYRDYAEGIEVDSQGNIYVTGYTDKEGIHDNYDYMTLKYVQVSTPDILNPVLFTGTVGTNFDKALTVSDGLLPFTWQLVSGNLPVGLALDGSTGHIAGIPAETGSFVVSIQVTDANLSTDSETVTISIYDPLVIMTNSLASGILGTGYAQMLTATGGLAPYAWTVYSGSLPDGLVLNNATGEISGTPTETGTFTFRIGASDVIESLATQELTIFVDYPDADEDGFKSNVDCNDNDDSIYPGAPEVKHDGIDQDCNGYDLTIEIIRARYRNSRNRLTVRATSTYGANAALEVEGYGPMTWDAGNVRWELRITLPIAPSTVTVTGLEGSETSSVTIN